MTTWCTKWGKWQSFEQKQHGALAFLNVSIPLEHSIVSWGEGCGKSRKPGVYASVQYHYSWIQTTVCNATHVETSSDLCLMAALRKAPILSGRTTSLACGSLKQVGSTCNYGGECCSGVCSSSSFFYQRVCQEDAMATKLYRQSGSQRRLRSRYAD
jgi:hypothetical protein